MQAFGRALPRIRSCVARDLAAHRNGQPLTRTLVLATLVRLLDTTYLRVGNEEYAATNRSYGLTTLRTRHVQLKGSQLKLRFRGKSGVLRLACTQSATPTATDKNVRYNAKAILAEVARQLGNTPAVCKKSYVHPAVLELGTRLASDAGPGLQAVWNHIGGTTSPRGLSAAERRLLAFLRKPQKLHKARPTTKA